MKPFGSPFLIFDVHYDGTFNFTPLSFDMNCALNFFCSLPNRPPEIDKNECTSLLKDLLSHLRYTMGGNDIINIVSLRKHSSILVSFKFSSIPEWELDKGLKIIENDMNFIALYNYAHSYRKIHMYITHGPHDLALFYVENLCFYGFGDEVKSKRKTVRKDAGNMSVEELVSWAEEEATMTSKAKEKVYDDDITMTSVVDKGKGLVDKGKRKMIDEGNAVKSRKSARSRNSGIVIVEIVNPSFSKDDDSDSDLDMEKMFQGNTDMEEMFNGNTYSKSEYSDKCVDYLSQGEDELISLRKRNSEAKKTSNPGKKNSNTQEASCSRPNKVYDVSEKYVNVDQLNECLTYYSLANGFYLWFYRSLKDQVIARCRFRPEKLKDSKKGKQRKRSKHPSRAGRDELSNCPFICCEYLEKSFDATAPILLNEEPEYSLSMGYEHLSTTPETESGEVTESSAKNLVPIPSEYEVTSDDESEYDVPVKDDSSSAFTAFSNPLFDDNDDFTSSDDESLPDEDVPTEEFKVYSNPLFDDGEINSNEIDPHCFNAESDLIESLLNRDTLIDSSTKFYFLLKDFSGELAHINPILPEIKEADFDLEEEIRFVENLLYDNSSSRPPEELNAKIADTIVESLSPSPIPVEDSNSLIDEIDLFLAMDELLPSTIESDGYDSEGDIRFLEELLIDDSIPLSENESSDHHNNPLFPRPPLEPPDVEFCFDLEPDLISALMFDNDELECFDPGEEINVFCK
nr:pentatricopeptide repeat-containing protein [Tanacetum cinerariifolium]